MARKQAPPRVTTGWLNEEAERLEKAAGTLPFGRARADLYSCVATLLSLIYDAERIGIPSE